MYYLMFALVVWSDILTYIFLQWKLNNQKCKKRETAPPKGRNRSSSSAPVPPEPGRSGLLTNSLTSRTALHRVGSDPPYLDRFWSRLDGSEKLPQFGFLPGFPSRWGPVTCPPVCSKSRPDFILKSHFISSKCFKHKN